MSISGGGGNWLPLLPSVISAASGLLGAIIGGAISYLTQRWLYGADRKEQRRALAAGIAAEIEAYLDLMDRRRHHEPARALIERLERGEDTPIRGWANVEEKPLEQFPLMLSNLRDLGQLGDDCFDTGKFLALIAGVRTTLIEAERGKYDQLSPQAKASFVRQELAIWDEALELARSLVPRLKQKHGID